MANTTTKLPPVYLYTHTGTIERDDLDGGWRGAIHVRPVFATESPTNGYDLHWPQAYGEEKKLNDLIITGGISTQKAHIGQPTWYARLGYEVSYSRLFPMTLHDIEVRAKFLRKLEDSYERTCERLGRPTTFGQVVAWYAEHMKVKGVIRQGHMGYSLMSGAIADNIQYLATEAAREVREKAGLDRHLPESEEKARAA